MSDIGVQEWTVTGILLAGIIYLARAFFPAAIKKIEQKDAEKLLALEKLQEKHDQQTQERDAAFRAMIEQHETRMDRIEASNNALVEQVIKESNQNRMVAERAINALQENSIEKRMLEETRSRIEPILERSMRIIEEYELRKSNE